MKKLAVLFSLAASPAFAAEEPFFTIWNTHFVVTIAFVLFVGTLFYLGVHRMLAKALDDRAAGIRAELDEAKSLREEAQALLASFERKQQEVAEHSERIIEHAKAEAAEAAGLAKEELKRSIARRLAGAQEQIASAEAGAVKAVRDRAIQVAVAAAAEVIAGKMTATDADKLIDEAIVTVEAKLH